MLCRGESRDFLVEIFYVQTNFEKKLWKASEISSNYSTLHNFNNPFLHLNFDLEVEAFSHFY